MKEKISITLAHFSSLKTLAHLDNLTKCLWPGPEDQISGAG